MALKISDDVLEQIDHEYRQTLHEYHIFTQKVYPATGNTTETKFYCMRSKTYIDPTFGDKSQCTASVTKNNLLLSWGGRYIYPLGGTLRLYITYTIHMDIYIPEYDTLIIRDAERRDIPLFCLYQARGSIGPIGYIPPVTSTGRRATFANILECSDIESIEKTANLVYDLFARNLKSRQIVTQESATQTEDCGVNVMVDFTMGDADTEKQLATVELTRKMGALAASSDELTRKCADLSAASRNLIAENAVLKSFNIKLLESNDGCSIDDGDMRAYIADLMCKTARQERELEESAKQIIAMKERVDVTDKIQRICDAVRETVASRETGLTPGNNRG